MQVNKIKTPELFCQKYWKRFLSQNATPVESLSESFHIHDTNLYLIGGYKPISGKNLTSVIAMTDKEFKLYKPTDKKLTLWRGICGVEMYKHPYMKLLMAKCKKLKKGDILCMREYAYATDKKEQAQGIYTQNDGILYEITVPKGSRIADDWNYIFPRYSKFLCTENTAVKEENENYRLIKLTYLQPNSPLPQKPKQETFWQKLKSLF